MTSKIYITEQANTDLRNIFEYIAFTLLEPEIAKEQLDRFEKSIVSLEKMPERFRLVQKEPWHSKGLRQMPIDNFIVFYIPNNKDHTVSVIRVMFGGRDIDEQFKWY